MKSVQNVRGFQLIERHPGYDTVNNPQHLTVADLTPAGITWQSDGVVKTIRNPAGVDGLPLSDLSGIAAVEAPYDAGTNRASIVNADGSVRAQIDSQTEFGRVMFYDVHYVNGTLAFLAATQSRDVRIEVSEIDGSVLRITESR